MSRRACLLLLLPAAVGCSPAGMPAAAQAAGPGPAFGRTFAVRPVSGIVLYRRPGHAPHRLTQRRVLPFGWFVDARRGKLVITVSKDRSGRLQRGRVDGGPFVLTQRSARPTVTLAGGDFSRCSANGGRAITAAVDKRRRHRPAPKPVRTLTLDESGGSFKTEARYSSTQGEGTSWEVTDYCGFTTVRAIAGKLKTKPPRMAQKSMEPGDVFSSGCVEVGARDRVFCMGVETGRSDYHSHFAVFAIAGMSVHPQYVLCLTRPDASQHCLPAPADPAYLPDAVAGAGCFGQVPGTYSARWYAEGRPVGPDIPFELRAPFTDVLGLTHC